LEQIRLIFCPDWRIFCSEPDEFEVKSTAKTEKFEAKIISSTPDKVKYAGERRQGKWWYHGKKRFQGKKKG